MDITVLLIVLWAIIVFTVINANAWFESRRDPASVVESDSRASASGRCQDCGVTTSSVYTHRCYDCLGLHMRREAREKAAERRFLFWKFIVAIVRGQVVYTVSESAHPKYYFDRCGGTDGIQFKVWIGRHHFSMPINDELYREMRARTSAARPC